MKKLGGNKHPAFFIRKAMEQINMSKLVSNEIFSQETLDIVAQELHDLEKNPTSGWDVRNPTLYNVLLTVTQELSSKFGQPAPHIVIAFQGHFRYQAAAQLMTDGSKQIWFGIEFIRDFLINQPPEERLSMLRSFRWVVAHELGHLYDPWFQQFGRSYRIRVLLDKVIMILLCVGVIGSISLLSITDLAPVSVFILRIGLVLFAIKNLGIVFLFRKFFEYRADRLALSCSDYFDVEDAQRALIAMTKAMKNSIVNQPKNQNPIINFFSWCVQQYKIWDSFGPLSTHPSIKSRLAYMRKVIQLRTKNS
jgi:hypothetical protein